MTSAYLTFDHTESVNGLTLYYFQVSFIPWGVSLDLLAHFLGLGDDLADLLGLYDNAPAVIDAGTSVWSLSGAQWVAPVDLHKWYGSDTSLLLNGSVLPGVDNLFAYQPFIIYAPIPPDQYRPVVLPDGAQEAFNDCVTRSRSTFVPDDLISTKQLTVASRFNDFPFWTCVFPSLLGAYGGCVFNPNGWPSHVSLALTGYAWNIEGFAEDMPYLRHNGHAFLITTCNTALGSWPLWIESSGSFSSLNTLAPCLQTPVFTFAPDLVGLPVPVDDVFLPYRVFKRISFMPHISTPDVSSSRRFLRFRGVAETLEMDKQTLELDGNVLEL